MLSRPKHLFKRGFAQSSTIIPPTSGFQTIKIPKDRLSTNLNSQANPNILKVGIDVGSTTVKVVVLDSHNDVKYSTYQRHRADVRATVVSALSDCLNAIDKVYPNSLIKPVVTGSGGLAVSNLINIKFVQEVIASTTAVQRIIPDTDVAVELGGEDAKITYFKGGIEQRMNGTCAGGTGAFIDQMAALLETDANGLNKLARGAQTIYPIAARCGVFAKTDIQPLINEGARREDIASSIYQAVVSQTISGLACGKPIRGKVAFLGGPLHFQDQLQRRFIETLKLPPQNRITIPNANLFVAIGAALCADAKPGERTNKGVKTVMKTTDLRSHLGFLKTAELHEVRRLDPLFNSKDELEKFRARHAKAKCKRGSLKDAKGPLFLGIDAGSTTTKAVLIDKEGAVLWQFYETNKGDPVALAVNTLKDLYKKLPKDVYIGRAVSTGYGEVLFQSALGVDGGEVETIAHHRATDFFLPGVEFVLDIGGQDMKCVKIKDGAITSIQLNEACSSGCGSFLDNFARSLGMSIQEFAEKALLASSPVDLGSRCTVFMNSRVKQSQKEGASVADISAGLSYSVIKNALIKVIKMRDPTQIGEKVVVQGGTFENDAVLRAFELVSGREVIRPDISGLMGAYGAALIARDTYKGGKSSIATQAELENFKVTIESKRCGGCNNNCLLTINTFNDGSEERQFITGNRCEKGLERNLKGPQIQLKEHQQLPNLVNKKYDRLFKYKPLPITKAPRGVVGIPRVLNIYEDYPFWHTFFTELGFRVQLSPRSTRRVYEMGLESIPSESACFPAKIAHGHVEALLKKCKFIFYPCANNEVKEDPTANKNYNCPIVATYSEVLKNNIDQLRQDSSIKYMNPFIPIDDLKSLKRRLCQEFPDIPAKEVKAAVEKGWNEQIHYREDIHKMGEEALEEMNKRGLKGVVLAGRPYHIDPEINHGIPELINQLGLAVLTEDSVAHLGTVERPLRVVDQWTFHNRLYRAAQFVTTQKNLEFVQFTSFGCGLDAVTSDQIEEILESKGRMYTLIKVDEGSNLGAIRIRMRSLLAAMKNRPNGKNIKPASFEPPMFDLAKKEAGYTILGPQMSPIHFQFIEKVANVAGHNIKILPSLGEKGIDEGLKYVNNDACYPSIIVTGQFIEALKSGKYDLNKTALAITQTCGVCRATNYVGFIRKALQDNGWGHIPVLTLAAKASENHTGFRFTPGFLHRLAMSIVYGDLLMRLLYRTRPYELIPGSAEELYQKYCELFKKQLESSSLIGYSRIMNKCVQEFDTLPLREVKKPRVGIVGEILVKFHPRANNGIIETIESEGAEAVVPDLYDFFLYCVDNDVFMHQYCSTPLAEALKAKGIMAYMEAIRQPMKNALKKSKRFLPPAGIANLRNMVDGIVQLGNIAGEGWLLTAEMVELLHTGVHSIACLQPFACLPNHVTGKGMIKELRRRYPGSNILAIDYDPGASEVNQLNRLKLLLSNAVVGAHPDETKTTSK